MNKQLSEHLPYLIRFCIVGVSNTIISYVTFKVTLYLIGIAWLSQGWSYTVGILWSYLLNRKWTFSKAYETKGQFLRFVSVQLGLMVASAACIGLLVDVMHFNNTWSWLGVMAVVTIANYGLCKFFVFPIREELP
jgi:putative flippase GtrA